MFVVRLSLGARLGFEHQEALAIQRNVKHVWQTSFFEEHLRNTGMKIRTRLTSTAIILPRFR